MATEQLRAKLAEVAAVKAFGEKAAGLAKKKCGMAGSCETDARDPEKCVMCDLAEEIRSLASVEPPAFPAWPDEQLEPSPPAPVVGQKIGEATVFDDGDKLYIHIVNSNPKLDAFHKGDIVEVVARLVRAATDAKGVKDV